MLSTRSARVSRLVVTPSDDTRVFAGGVAPFPPSPTKPPLSRRTAGWLRCPRSAPSIDCPLEAIVSAVPERWPTKLDKIKYVQLGVPLDMKLRLDEHALVDTIFVGSQLSYDGMGPEIDERLWAGQYPCGNRYSPGLAISDTARASGGAEVSSMGVQNKPRCYGRG